jgi:hypothetical protein
LTAFMMRCTNPPTARQRFNAAACQPARSVAHECSKQTQSMRERQFNDCRCQPGRTRQPPTTRAARTAVPTESARNRQTASRSVSRF